MSHKSACPVCGHKFECEGDEYLDQAMQDRAENYADSQREAFDY